MVTTATAQVELVRGCVVARIGARARQSLADAKDNLAATVGMAGGRRRPLLIDISRCEPLEPEVRHYYSGERLTEAFVALALVIDARPLGRMMGNVYLRIARPGIPTQLFVGETEALSWLERFTT